LVPALGGGDDVFAIGFSDEGAGIVVVVLDEAVDGRLQVDQGAQGAALEAPGQPGEEALDVAAPGPEAGVQWKVQRAWRASRWRTFGCLQAA
jgi:hypothetical protein